MPVLLVPSGAKAGGETRLETHRIDDLRSQRFCGLQGRDEGELGPGQGCFLDNIGVRLASNTRGVAVLIRETSLRGSFGFGFRDSP